MPREPVEVEPQAVLADLADQLHRTLFAVEIAALASAAQALKDVDGPVAIDLLAEIRAILVAQRAESDEKPGPSA